MVSTLVTVSSSLKYFSNYLVNAITGGKMLVEAVCDENDINEGEMKQFNMGPGKVLLTKHQGVVSAVSAKCTHYGALLITGAYDSGRVRCPWHGACFSTTTGDIEDFPGLDSLHKYQVDIQAGKIHVTADEDSLTNFRRVKPTMSDCRSGGRETIVVLGSGPSSLTCAETLRQEGFHGDIIMIGEEKHPPYDRPKLSKMLDTEPAKLYLRDERFLAEKSIQQLHKMATNVDVTKQTVTCSDGSTFNYDKLFVGTGGRPRKLRVPGADLENICYLRSPEDGNSIAAKSQGKNVVILGTGFIGLEVASYLTGKATSVSVIGSGRSKIPFERLLGAEVGGMFLKMHKEKGVQFHMESPLKEVQGLDGKVDGIVLQDGTRLQCDVVVSGIGVEPSTDFMNDFLDGNGHLVVDEYMCAGGNVYGGGDIVSFPYTFDGGRHVNIGHWQLSQAHGRCAALNMLGQKKPLRTIPFFWTGQFGKSLRYAGHCSDFDEIVYEGDVEAMKFTAYYCREDKVYAVASLNMGAKSSELAFKLEDGTCPTASELKKLDDGTSPTASKLKKQF